MTRRKILIVDNEYDITFVFKIILDEKGFFTDICNDPVDALSMYQPYYYDLVMIDLKLPEMTGFELYNQIRMIDKSTKVCFLTSSEQFHKQYRDKEFQDFDPDLFIQKPVEHDVLINKITNLSRCDILNGFSMGMFRLGRNFWLQYASRVGCHNPIPENSNLRLSPFYQLMVR